MKKTVIILLFGFLCGAQADIASDLKGEFEKWTKGVVGELLGQMSGLLDNSVSGICYAPTTDNSAANLNFCQLIGNKKFEVKFDICEHAPNIPGFKKKENVFSLEGNSDDYLKGLCEETEKMAQTAIKDIDLFSTENNFSSTSGDAENAAGDVVAELASKTKLIKNQESVARQAIYSGKQNVLKEAVNFAKNTKTDISKITLQQLSAPANYTDYLKQRKVLIKGAFADYSEQSPATISSTIRNKVAAEQDTTKAMQTANQLSTNASDKIDFGMNKRIQLYLDVLAEDDDYAIPTQDMVSLLREDLRGEAIAKIKQQMKREALIVSELMRIDQARKDLLTIAGNKAVVISRKFPATQVKQEIDGLINSGSGGSSIGGGTSGAVSGNVGTGGGLPVAQ